MKKESYIKHLFRSYKNFKKKSSFSKKNYFKERKLAFKRIAKELNVSYSSLFFDYLKTVLFLGETWQFYIMDEMFNLKFKEKRERLTTLKAFNLDYKYNKYATDEERERLNRREILEEGRKKKQQNDEYVRNIAVTIAQYRDINGASFFVLSLPLLE